MSIGIRKAPKWWEKGLQPNMKEVTGAQDLVDSLVNAGDKLVIVDFFSPGCGGCKALHPKVIYSCCLNCLLYVFVRVSKRQSKIHKLLFFGLK